MSFSRITVFGGRASWGARSSGAWPTMAPMCASRCDTPSVQHSSQRPARLGRSPRSTPTYGTRRRWARCCFRCPRFPAAPEGNKSRASAMVHPVNVGGKESSMGRGICSAARSADSHHHPDPPVLALGGKTVANAVSGVGVVVPARAPESPREARPAGVRWSPAASPQGRNVGTHAGRRGPRATMTSRL